MEAIQISVQPENKVTYSIRPHIRGLTEKFGRSGKTARLGVFHALL